jgi:hypothetical protein
VKTAGNTVETVPRSQLEQACTDLLRPMITTFVQALVGAEADRFCGGVVMCSEERTKGTGAGTHPRRGDRTADPQPRTGTYFRD